MKRFFLYIFILLIVIVNGCGDRDKVTYKHEVSLYKNSLIEIGKGINNIDLCIDSGNLQIYCWDKKELRFEAKHTVRDTKTNEELEKQLKKYSIMSKEKENTFFYTVSYKGNIKNSEDIYTDIKLTIPRRIKKIDISQQYGSLIIEDKFEGDISAQMDSVNSEIKFLNGKFIYKCKKGNLRLDSGKLSNESCVDINFGSIYIKTECQEQSKYLFQTKSGNVDLNFPINSKILFESFGLVKNNQFTGMEGNILIKTSTKIGKISVNGY